jgi:NADPH:quinone reductase-like Zn-dependent oxidoreductase
LSDQPLKVEPRLVISGPRTVEGFWLGHWMRERTIPSALLLFREIANLNRQGVLRSEIGRSYPLEDVIAAVEAAQVVGRQGKVLLKLRSSG